MTKPTIGRIVHFVQREGVTLPAVIVSVSDSEKANLQVFLNQSGPNLAHVANVEQSEAPEVGKFHFPQIVAAPTAEDPKKPAKAGKEGK